MANTSRRATAPRDVPHSPWTPDLRSAEVSTSAAHAVARALLFATLITSTACARSTRVNTTHADVAANGRTSPAARGQATALEGLQATLRSVLAQPTLGRGTWGVSVWSLDRRESLFSFNATKLLLPASTLKIVTLATAAKTLGWEHQFVTTLWRTGPVVDGVLAGDLVVRGSGDPTVDNWDDSGAGPLAEWALALRASGIRTIRGRLIGDDNVFDDRELGNGWAWDDLDASYAAPISGLQFNQNTAIVDLTSAPPSLPSDGTAVAVGESLATVRPHFAPIRVVGFPSLTSVEQGRTAEGVGGRRTIVVNDPPARGTTQTRRVAVPNGTEYFCLALLAQLAQNGIDVTEGIEDVDALTRPLAAPESWAQVAEWTSPTLDVVGATMMRLSQNLFAESLLKTLAVSGGVPGSTADGIAVVQSALSAWGVGADEIVMVDGSGLSRYNLVTTSALVRVLDAVRRDPTTADLFAASLPIGGQSGTLSGRFRHTAAAGNVKAKTGSFSQARGLAGYVTTGDGENLAFAILANNFGVSPSLIDAATDAMVVELATFHRETVADGRHGAGPTPSQPSASSSR